MVWTIIRERFDICNLSRVLRVAFFFKTVLYMPVDFEGVDGEFIINRSKKFRSSWYEAPGIMRLKIGK